MKKLLLTLLAIVVLQQTFAQNYKFGKVSKEELEEQYYPLDSSANAAYLYKKRRTYFKYFQGEGFKVITEVHERIKIYNKDGYDWATKEIDFYAPDSGSDEKVSIKAAKTYSLSKGKIQVVKLNKKDVFDQKTNRYWSERKFTMPNISEGCVVEWNYIIISPYTSIYDVLVQYPIPVKRYEANIQVPEYYKYNIKQLGYIPISINKSSKNSSINFVTRHEEAGSYDSRKSFSSSNVNFKTMITEIIETDIPALIEEPFVNSMDNYRALIDFELTSIQWPNQSPQFFTTSWEEIAKDILKASRFGGELDKIGHLKDDIARLKTESSNSIEKINNALHYVKTKIKWNGMLGKYPENGLKKAYKEGTGNIGDINLTLVAVLRELGLDANPVLLSTRNNGIPLFPTSKGINYVIAHVKTSDGYIPFRCF